MRIRKNAKLSTFLHTNTNPSTHSHESSIHINLCQLNQSPWDIITFPSSDSSSSLQKFDDNEGYYNVNLSGNWSSIDSIAAFESVASMKTLPEGENNNINANGSVNDAKNDYELFNEISEREVRESKIGSSEIQEEIELCGKTDEKGWQCGRVVKNGNTMCGHHLAQLQNHAVWPTKKKLRPVSGHVAENRPRLTKKRGTVAAGPHEFYYYSGFGPSWGKKRETAGRSQDNKNIVLDDNKVHEVSGTNGDMGVEDEVTRKFEPVTFEVGPIVAELDYIEEEEDEEEKMKKVGKKRGRKPVKARSLKSLM